MSPSIEDLRKRSDSTMTQSEDLVMMPDMFVSFLAIEPQINPNYETAKKESEAWFAE